MHNLFPDVFHQQLRDLGKQLTVAKHVEPQVANVVLQHICVERKLDQIFEGFGGRDLKEWKLRLDQESSKTQCPGERCHGLPRKWERVSGVWEVACGRWAWDGSHV